MKGGFQGSQAYEETSALYDTNPLSDSISSPFTNGSPTARPEVTQVDYRTNRSVNYHVSRFTGCFGDGYFGLLQYREDVYDPILLNRVVKGQIYRGVKHGLINPTPLYSSAVFNGTQFGQLRDMMEQRQYTRFSLNNNTLTDSAVSVEFINRGATPGTLNIVSGSFTNSSNISKFATSEHPYDDGRADYDLIWDRDTPLPETLIAL